MKQTRSQNIKAHYNNLQKNYLKCWGSRAKQDISRFELDFIRQSFKNLSHLKKPIKVLEVGLGPGRIAQEILRQNVTYYGLDISDKMVAYSSTKFSGNKKVKKITLSDISRQNPFSQQKFDLIVAVRVFQYNKNWPEIISKLSKKLTPQGVMLFSMLNRRSSAILGRLLADKLLTGHYTDYKQITSTLAQNKLKILQLTGYARLPDVVYDACNHPFLAYLLRLTEKTLTLLLGKVLFVRMFYISAQKK